MLPFKGSLEQFQQRNCLPKENPAQLKKDLLGRTEKLKDQVENIYTSLQLLSKVTFIPCQLQVELLLRFADTACFKKIIF